MAAAAPLVAVLVAVAMAAPLAAAPPQVSVAASVALAARVPVPEAVALAAPTFGAFSEGRQLPRLDVFSGSVPANHAPVA